MSAVGEGVEDVQVGEAVFGVCDAGQEGAYAEKIAIKSSIIAKKPDDTSHVDACALALTGLTALISVEDTLHLRSGETILIQGGAGGVAGVAIELAKHLGARVITTASAANHEHLRGLGADEVIDYHVQDFTEVGAVCDAVFETVGGDVMPSTTATALGANDPHESMCAKSSTMNGRFPISPTSPSTAAPSATRGWSIHRHTATPRRRYSTPKISTGGISARLITITANSVTPTAPSPIASNIRQARAFPTVCSVNIVRPPHRAGSPRFSASCTR